MNDPYIHKLLLHEEMTSKLELVEMFSNYYKEKKFSSDLKSLLNSYLAGSNSAQRVSSRDLIRIHGPRTGLSRFVASHLYVATAIESIENKLSVLDELRIVLQSLHLSKNPILKVTTVSELVKLLQQFLGEQFDRLTYHRFLSVFLVPFESKLVNAVFDNNSNSIAVFRTRDKEAQTPEYIFLHEFGHAIHCKIFKLINDVPKSFLDFMQDLDENFVSYPKEEKVEIYADFFSIAVMCDTEFESHNPIIKVMQKGIPKMIQEYFRKELSISK
jgi:hypothetical protein